MKAILSFVTVLLLGAGFVGCNKDDDVFDVVDPSVIHPDSTTTNEDSPNENDSIIVDANLLGKWQLLGYSGGFMGVKEDIETGKVIVTFTKEGDMLVTNEGAYVPSELFISGTHRFTLVDINRSIYTGQPARVLRCGFIYLYYIIRDEKLELYEEAYDGFDYSLEKI